MTRPVVLLTSGTRGDVLPYISLAVGLRTQGLEGVIATHESFRGLVETHKIPFIPLSENPTDLLTKPGAMPLTFNGNLYRSIHISQTYMRAARPLFTKMLASAWDACQGASSIIIGLPTFWGHSIAQALGIPEIWCPLQPLTPTGMFPSVLQPFTFSLGSAYNRLTHWLTQQGIWHAWRREINQWRTGLLSLPPLPLAGPYKQIKEKQVPFIYGISSHVLQKPGDWPAWHNLFGYWFLESHENWEPPPDLVRFLESGSPPVYIGFGSMDHTEKIEQTIKNAVQETRYRVIVSLRPNRLKQMETLSSSNIYTTQEIPHTWLFPRLRAAIHHGGAGTTAAGLHAGIPAAVIPVGVDQFFWGKQIHRLGVGLKPIPQRKLDAEKLTRILDNLANPHQIHSLAKRLGQKIKSENGVENAVAEIKAILG